jgi:large subunit ribosomal protein L18
MAKSNRAAARERRHIRVRKKISGSAARPRLNVFRSLEHIYAQIIDDEAGQTLAAASTVDHDLRGTLNDLNKTEQARAVGKAIAERARSQGIENVVFDRGGFPYHGRIKALAEGSREGGLAF